jgi:NDP-4-keto-2,6-dideoxyhexose 3-C-methyltransferase
MNCKNCNQKILKKVITIGRQPISSVFLSKKNKNLRKYPLDLYECQNCKLIQFNKLASKQNMYGSTYGYRTSLSKMMISHMNKKYKKILKMNILKDGSNVLDIGSNDGTFLNFFINKKKKLNYFGIDPSAKKFAKYYKKDINLIIDFFSFSKIINLLNRKKIINKNFSLISSFAMFYDISNPNLFCKNISNLLEPNGIWILEMSYFPLLLSNLTYDQICHEHVTYYTLGSFNNIIKKNDLKINDISFNEINGGSIEIICSKKNSKFKVNKQKIKNIFNEENKINNKSYDQFNQRIFNVKKKINFFLNKFAKTKKIIGYGASTKGNIVLNHCGINSKHMGFICDGNPEKHGKYTPGSNIKIISKEQMRMINPDYLFVLIWPFRSEVIKQEEKYIKKGGKLIFHLPRFHIINKNNYQFYLKKDFKSFAYTI